MIVQQVVAVLLILSTLVSGPAAAWVGAAAPPPPPGPAGTDPPSGDFTDITPPRVSYVSGEASFWRPGAPEWAPAALNTPLAPGDVLYTAPGGNVEIQFAPHAFARASDGSQIGLDNQEPDFVQFRVTAGHAALDVRDLDAGRTVEIETPNAAFTIEHPGYYHVDVAQDTTTFRVHRGGRASVTPAGGPAGAIAANQQVVVAGLDSPRLEMGPAIELTAWDRWNYQRTDGLLASASERPVAPDVYGTDSLEQYGDWRTVPTYGRVWVPAGVPASWVPYSTGRWIWDPRFGWTWLDDAPWGWAPYHYGRWVFVGPYWAWAPGPIIARPVYAPALVVFLGGGVIAKVGRPICWAPLGWGEPLVPWWGRPGFAGKPWWGGWGGPRVVNNVVINRTTVVNVANITKYRNVDVTNAVVGVPADRFGHGASRPARVTEAETRQLRPVRGAFAAKPVAASLLPASGRAVKPPAAVRARAVVATRPPRDIRPMLRAHGLDATTTAEPAPRLVSPPRSVVNAPGAAPSHGRVSAPGGRSTKVDRVPDRAPGKADKTSPRAEERRRSVRSTGDAPRPAAPSPPATIKPPAPHGGPPAPTVRPRAPERRDAPPPAVQSETGPRARSVERPGPGDSPARIEPPQRVEPAARAEPGGRGQPRASAESPGRGPSRASLESGGRDQPRERADSRRGEGRERNHGRSDRQDQPRGRGAPGRE